MKITALYTYPIKSLSGISLEAAKITATGFSYDRLWMLVDENGSCLTQRDYPKMALFQVTLAENTILVQFGTETLRIDKELSYIVPLECTIWGSKTMAHQELSEHSEWFSDLLNANVRLVRKLEQPKRSVKNHPDAAVNFPDSNPYLILGESSLSFLNSKLETPVSMNRFRPNIIFDGGVPHIEDKWKSIRIGAAIFEVTKPCARCNLITIDQSTAAIGTEPLRTLAQYRRSSKKILFGQYLKSVEMEGKIVNVGDELHCRSIR
ncbi:MAG: MOSC N-terminal beta barrel domain-containing protein [Bacteroidota bacterium]